jgi:hypothetical protein
MSDITEPLTEREGGFEAPTVRQFTVFLDNRVGLLQLLLRVLSEADVAIVAFSVEESAECALVRLVAAKPDAAAEVLRAHQFPFSRTDVLAVGLPASVRHPLIAVCAVLLSAEINIHYTYPMLQRSAIVLSVDDPTLAAQALLRKSMALLSETDLAGP